MDKVISTIVGVVIAIGVSGAIFIGANLLFDMAPKRFRLFTSMLGGLAGFVVALILWGNGVSAIVDGPLITSSKVVDGVVEPEGLGVVADYFALFLVDVVLPLLVVALVAGFLYALTIAAGKVRSIVAGAAVFVLVIVLFATGSIGGLWIPLALVIAALIGFIPFTAGRTGWLVAGGTAVLVAAWLYLADLMSFTGTPVLTWVTKGDVVEPTGIAALLDIVFLVVVNSVIPVAIGAVAGYLLATASEVRERLLIGLVGGVAIGGYFGAFAEDSALPSFDTLALVIWPLAGAVVGAAIWWISNQPSSLRAPLGLALGAAAGVWLGVEVESVLAVIVGGLLGLGVGYLLTMTPRRDFLTPVILWATLGWVVGAILVPELGFDDMGELVGSRFEAIVAGLGIGAGLGALVGLTRLPGDRRRDAIATGSRSYIFLAPAISFISLALVVPAARTIILSFKDQRGDEWVGARNYGDIFTDPTIVKVDEWSSIFGSAMFWWGAVLLAVGIIGGILIGRRTGHSFEVTGGSGPPLALGVFLLSFAVFAALRGTVFNNLWWVFTVTILATSLGLAIAVLADRAKFESAAKSIIFLPMAISFVGASIIWRFMYIARPPTKQQTGVMNSIWVGLGQLSTSDMPRYVVSAVLLVIVAGLGYLAYRGWKAGATGLMAGSIVTALPLVWIVYRFMGIPFIQDPLGLGGYTFNSAGERINDTILFLQTAPMNNVWLMVVLIWIQTGFSMVIFSAAIKGVPNDLIEAAKVDGATESQTFWRVVIPQIATTIGVVVTTLIVLVMKVFDIVKVMTNGNFDTQVLANEMWQRAFTEFNFGLGAAVAIVLFVSVVPIMYINIRRMQKAAA